MVDGDALAGAIEAQPESMGMRVGVVTQVLPLEISFQGTETPGVGRLDGYVPQLGDNVAVSRRDDTWVALGRTASDEAARVGLGASRSLTAQGIPNTTPTIIIFDGKVDPYGLMGALPANTVVIPAGQGGLWAITLRVNCAGSGARNFIQISPNGQLPSRASFVPGEDFCSANLTATFAAGQSFQFWIYQSSGGAVGSISTVDMNRIS